MEIATKANGQSFGMDEMATESTIEHTMSAVEFMIYCDEYPLPILCDCGCKEVADHNSRVRKTFGY